jgi:isocitrate dehydrogenase
MYLAEALANQNENEELAKTFAPVAKELKDMEEQIMEELMAVEGKPADIGGYYRPDDEKAAAAMRPSKTLNKIIDNI